MGNYADRKLLYFAIIASVINILALFTPSIPPSPPAPSNAEQKLRLTESLRALTKNRNYWFLFIPVPPRAYSYLTGASSRFI